MLCVVPLRADQKSPFAPKSDEEGAEDEEDKGKKDEEGSKADEAKKGEGEKSDEKKSDEKKSDEEKKADEKADEEKEAEEKKPVEIEFDGFEHRVVVLPIHAGNFGRLEVNDEGALIYVRRPIQGMDGEPSIHVFDPGADEPEEKLVAKDAGGFTLLRRRQEDPRAGPGRRAARRRQGGRRALRRSRLAGLEVVIDPRAEWRELFDDAWRLMRDFFYDPSMHGIDWKAMHDQYAAMLADCGSRADLSFVIKEMISELNVGHAYYSGGDEAASHASVGLLGCDYELADGAYRIARIHEGASWDADARGRSRSPGVDVKAATISWP
jgi:tricorn protease